jgi:hypothetical protein
MMTGQLVKLMGCRDAIQAETIRNRLEAAGIMAVVQGAEVGTALSYVGVAIGYPNIEVEAKDLKRAEELLAADRVSLQTVGAWTCSRCGEFNEPAFEVCWSCNKSRSDDDPRAIVDPEDAETPQSFNLPVGTMTTAPSATVMGDASNPYRPFAWGGSDSTSQEIRLGMTIEDEDKEAINRAFIAAVIGAFLPFVIITLYSLAILVRLSLKPRPDKLKRTKTYYLTLVINFLVLLATAIFVLGT